MKNHARASAQRIDESYVRNALGDGDLEGLCSRLEALRWSPQVIGDLADHVRRLRIEAFAPEALRARRRSLLGRLAARIRQEAGDQAAHRLDAAIEHLSIAEEGYRCILQSLATSPYASMEPASRAAAALMRAALRLDDLAREALRRVDPQGVMTSQHLLVSARDGNPVTLDAAVANVVSSASAMLAMEARRQGWERGGVVVLPALPVVDEEAIRAAESGEYLASVWSGWRRLEERGRYLAGGLAVLTAPEFPEGVPAGVRRGLALGESAEDWEILAAQTRLNDDASEIALEIFSDPRLVGGLRDPHQGARLAPTDFISPYEMLGYVELKSMLGYPPEDNEPVLDELTVVQLLRGYAALGVIAEEAYSVARFDGHPGLTTISVDELRLILKRFGLAGDAADTFVARATFRLESRDLFDTPLIAQHDGRLLIFGPALRAANPARVLRSTLSANNVTFSAKGQAFEKQVIACLRDQGLDARGFMVRRDGETYQFDVVVPWDDHLFVFECKNRGLPGEEPIQAHRFLEQTRKNAAQVSRLARALVEYPDMLEREYQSGASGKTIVPVVLNNLPFARSGRRDGCYHYDFGSLKLFFHSRALNLRIAQSVAGGRLSATVPTIPLWKDDRPTAEDLLTELEDPVALRVLRHHLSPATSVFELDATTVAFSPEYAPRPITMASMAALAGVDPAALKFKRDRALRRVKKLEKRSRA